MLNKKLSAGVVIVGVVVLIICVVVLTALLSLYGLTTKLSGTSATIFASVNLLVLLAMVPFGRNVSVSTSLAASVQIWFVTILYSVVQFVTLFLVADVWGNVAYTLFQLVVLALWFGIAGAAVVIGKRNHKREDSFL